MSKIGFHFLATGSWRGYGDVLKAIKAAGRTLALVKCTWNFGPAKEAKDIFGPSVLTVGRKTGLGWEGMDEHVGSDTDAAIRDIAARHFDLVYRPVIETNPWLDVIEVLNEYDSHYDWQARFYIALAPHFEALGKKMAMFAWSTGTPGLARLHSRPEPFDPSASNAILRVCQELEGHGHYLSMHEYGGVGTDTPTLRGTQPYHALRHRVLYEDVLKPAGLDDMPLILSEVGQNGGHNFIGIDALLEDMAWYDAELFEEKYTVACALWTLGSNSDFPTANFEAALPRLRDYIIATPTPPPPVDEPPPPTAAKLYELRMRLTLDVDKSIVSMNEASLKPVGEPPPPPPPVNRSWVGLHMAARGGPFIAGDWECLTRGKIEAAKLTSYNTFEDVNRLVTMIDPLKIVFRMFADMRDAAMTAAKFYEVHRAWLAHLASKGVRYIEVHNEPNLASEGLGTRWLDVIGFANYYTNVVAKIRTEFPGKFLAGFPGLSPQPNVDQWLPTLKIVFAGTWVDWIGVHSYWQTPAQMNDPNHGRYYRRFLQFDRPVILTEFSNNLGSVAQTVKASEYVAYYRSLQSEGALLGAFCYVSSSAPGSPDYERNEPWVNADGSLSPIPDIVGAR